MTNMLLVPTHWYSWDFDVTDGQRRLARVEMSAWREKGVLNVDGINHHVYREGLGSGDFILKRDSVVLAKATKPSAFRSAFTLTYNNREYSVRKRSVWGRAFVVSEGEGDKELGSLAPAHWWGRDATAEMPDNWPLHIGVFAIWLALLLWKREANSGGGS
jgi:hypothetical protein